MVPQAGSVTGSRIAVHLFGPPRIEIDGGSVPLDTRKALALFAYLVLTARPQSRDSLAALLWPEANQTRARSALRRTLSALNSALDGRGLRIERESLAFQPGEVTVDVDDFRAAAGGSEVDDWKRAVDVYGGEFLSGFVLRDSPDFDEWQIATADELKRELGQVLAHLSDLANDDAIAFARRWVELDTLHEPAYRALMFTLARSGDRTSALRQYRECVAALERELGVEPLEETTGLYESIREGRSLDAQPARSFVATEAIAELPLVGRDVELRALEDAYERAKSGRLVVIAGEPGIGKTRLATEFLASVAQRTSLVLTARCHPEEERMAFGTAIELLRAIPLERRRVAPLAALVEASRLLPELAEGADASAPLDSPAAQRRLLEGVADVLTGVCDGTSPGLVFVDDAQWMDESSRDVMRFIVRRLRDRRICVVFAWRSEEIPPAHPFRRMLADAKRDGLATEIVLGRLTEDDVDKLVRATDAPSDLSGSLFEETAGVPFFVAEYLKASGDRLPPGVRDLLASRVGSISGRAAQVLTAAAVIGRAFDPRTVRETSGRAADEVAAALEELTASDLIEESSSGYDFTHPKLREYVYDGATLGRRRLLHGRAAKSFVRLARRRPELAALAAQHLERSGDEEAAAEHFTRAGDHARDVYANAEALAHYRSAVALGHEDPAPLHDAIGDLLTLAGQYGDAISSYEKAIALGAEAGVVARKLGGVHHRLGDWASAEAHYLEAEEALAGGPGRARVLAERSRNAHRAERREEAGVLVSQALAEAEAEGDIHALAQAHNVAGIVASHNREPKRALEHLSASLELAERLNDPSANAAALNNLALVLRAQGTVALALDRALDALDLCRTIGDRHREAAVHSNVADILRDLGRSDEAMEHLKASAKLFADVGEAGEVHPEIWKLIEW